MLSQIEKTGYRGVGVFLLKDAVLHDYFSIVDNLKVRLNFHRRELCELCNTALKNERF